MKQINIVTSNKRGFSGQESYLITRGRTSYLRLIGNDPDYCLMTATASEDDKSYYVCSDKIKLISSALQLGARLNIVPCHEADSSGRKFIRICTMTFHPGKEQEEMDELRGYVELFFQIYDQCDPNNDDVTQDMQGIYSCLSHDDTGDDVYLSDGVWLSSDGKLHDKGR